MPDNARLSEFQKAVFDALSEFGVSDASVSTAVILTRGGHYIGHRFLFDDIQAVWLAGEGVIRVYADDGTLLGMVESGQGLPREKAA